jgi:hypothetical protein
MMFGLLGASPGGTMAMTQEERVNRIGENSPPASGKPNVVKRTIRAAGENSPPAQPTWLRNVNDYVRRQPREYAVTRFG